MSRNPVTVTLCHGASRCVTVKKKGHAERNLNALTAWAMRKVKSSLGLTVDT
jgi:hypothetical protein